MSELDEYQHSAQKYAAYEDKMYPRVSVVIEAAELCDLWVKPVLRGDDKEVKREDIISEAGDVLWNLAVLLDREDILLSEVAEANLDKLADRKSRGVIKGDGGDR